MERIRVNTGRKYDIFIERNILSSCGQIVKSVTKASTAAIVTDSNVAPLYLQNVKESLEKEGFKTVSFVFPAGETNKTIATITDILNFFAENSMTRSDIAVALGGGVTGDLTGFAAAIYMRGIEFVQIPTSLLAQIDSSVGGKTGADLPSGKNLCGAFHQPSAVIIDPEVLKTLPTKFFSDGMAEAIKYGCIGDAELFEKIAEGIDTENADSMIYRCVDIKREIVEHDEKEKGERMLLNFGHTLGHSAEKLSNFTLTHGEGVGIGMYIMAKAGEKQGVTEKGSSEKIAELLKKYSLPLSCDISLQDLCSGALTDKKRSGNSINIVLLNKIGSAFTKKLPVEELYDFVR